MTVDQVGSAIHTSTVSQVIEAGEDITAYRDTDGVWKIGEDTDGNSVYLPTVMR
jgi:hypothetical protein